MAKQNQPNSNDSLEHASPFLEEGSLEPDFDESSDEDPLVKKKKRAKKSPPKDADTDNVKEPKNEMSAPAAKPAADPSLPNVTPTPAPIAAAPMPPIAELAVALKSLERLPTRLVEALETSLAEERESRVEEKESTLASKLTLGFAAASFLFSLLSMGLAQSARRSALAVTEDRPAPVARHRAAAPVVHETPAQSLANAPVSEPVKSALPKPRKLAPMAKKTAAGVPIQFR